MAIDLTKLQIFNDAIMRNTDLSGCTRIQCDNAQEGNLGRFTIRQIPSNKYVHSANNAARLQFADALTSAFGVRSLEELPKDVRAVLKIEDFKLQDGAVTSTRPLTMRRIRAVMTAICDVTAKAVPSREDAAAIRQNFSTYLQNSQYMQAAFDRIAIAEGRKPLTLDIPLISNNSFEVPLSALKAYTKGIKPAELAQRLDDIKQAIANDAAIAKETLGQLMRGETVQPDKARANILRHYFALCAVASDDTGRGISRTVSVPDANGKIAEFLKASLKNSDDFDTGVVHTPADPFLAESQAMTRFSVEIGFKPSARYGGDTWMGALCAYENLVRRDGFSPIMKRGYDSPMAISQMYSNIIAEDARLLNMFEIELEAMFTARPELRGAHAGGNVAQFDLTIAPAPFKANIEKILSLRQALNNFFPKLMDLKPLYGNNPALRFANESILTATQIPAMNLGEVNPPAMNQVAEVRPQADPYEGVTLESTIESRMAKAPDRVPQEQRREWAIASLIDAIPPSQYAGNTVLTDYLNSYYNHASNGIPKEAMDFLATKNPRELTIALYSANADASGLRVASLPESVELYDLFMSGELPLTISPAFIKAMVTTHAELRDEQRALDEMNATDFCDYDWGFGTKDMSTVMKLVKTAGYDLATATDADFKKLMALARLCDFKLDDLPAFLNRVLHKSVPDITTDDLKKLFRMYNSSKLLDPLQGLKPGRTTTVIDLFKGEKLPSSTAISGKDMVRMVATLRELAKDGGAKEVTMRFNDKTVQLRQMDGGHLFVTVNGVMVSSAQTASNFVKIFESDMVAHAKQYGAANLLRMLPELTAADMADLPGSTSHLRELCLRIVEERFGASVSAFATVPTTTLRTIAANALKGYYSTETGAQHQGAISLLLAANTRNDVFTGEEVRDLHAAMLRTNREELNRKVVFANPPAVPSFMKKPAGMIPLPELQEKVRNLFADLMMDGDIISYDEAVRGGKGEQRVLDLLKKNIDVFVEVILDPQGTLGGLPEQIRTTLLEKFEELTDALPSKPENAAEKFAMRAIYRNVLTMVLDVAALPEAQRADTIKDKIDNAKGTLLLAFNSGKLDKEELKDSILEMLPMITGLDSMMDDLVTTAMTQIQDLVNERFGAAAPEEGEVEGAEPRNEPPIWQQSFDNLVGGALSDTSCGYGKFMHEVLSHYFKDASPQEGRQMLASLFRNTNANSTTGQVVGALFKGTGPLLQKMLQALPVDAFGEDMQDALRDMKSNLQPIPDAIVQAHMLDIVNRSNGEIKSIEVVRSLGAASVGQAFLCKMITDEHPAGEECVVKLLRPNVKTIIANERQRFIAAAKNTPGMEKTFEGQYARILEELDFTKEKTNINFARNVYEQPVLVYTDGLWGKERPVTMSSLHSMEVHPSVPPTMDSLILKKAPGETYDRYMVNARAKAREIIGEVNEEGKAFYKDPATLRATQGRLIHLYNDTKRRYDFLLQLAEKWVHGALYGNGFYHGDLHAGNIMTDGSGLTVIDFGNATHLTETERTHVMRMMAAAMYGRENYFEESLKALISAEGRAEYDRQNADGKLTKDLHEILNKGTSHNAGERIFAVLTHLQRAGIELPAAIYNFAQCQMRLGGAIAEMKKLLDELNETKNRLEIEPFGDLPQLNLPVQELNRLQVSENVHMGLFVFKNLINRAEGNSYRELARYVDEAFGRSDNAEFNEMRLPQLQKDFQTAINNPEAFDTYLQPFMDRLLEVNMVFFRERNGIPLAELSPDHGTDLREKLNAFLEARKGEDVELRERTSMELAKKMIEVIRIFAEMATAPLPASAEAPEDADFVYAVATVVSGNLRAAMSRLGNMSATTGLDMRRDAAARDARDKRIEDGAKKVRIYLNTYANDQLSAETLQKIERIARSFQHPADMPGLNGKTDLFKTEVQRATFLSTLQFNLNLLETELRAEGLLTDATTAEMKKHYVNIAMQYFADRIGGIGEAIPKLSDTTYAELFRAAERIEANGSGLLVRDALVHLRFPIVLPQNANLDAPANNTAVNARARVNAPVANPNNAPANGDEDLLLPADGGVE